MMFSRELKKRVILVPLLKIVIPKLMNSCNELDG